MKNCNPKSVHIPTQVTLCLKPAVLLHFHVYSHFSQYVLSILETFTLSNLEMKLFFLQELLHRKKCLLPDSEPDNG